MAKLPADVEAALVPDTTQSRQSFAYYAAHFLVGSGLTTGDVSGNLRSLTSELRRHYDDGHLDGRISRAEQER